MDSKLEWNLKEIYNNEESFEEDVKKLQVKTNEILEFKGKLSQSSSMVLECYKKLAEALELEEKLYAYAMLMYHKDMSNVQSIKLYKHIEKIVTDFSEKISFISPELSKIDDNKLQEFLEENEELKKEFKKSIEDIIKEKKHI